MKGHKFKDTGKVMPWDVYCETIDRGEEGLHNFFSYPAADGTLGYFVFRSNIECTKFKNKIFMRLPTLWAEAMESAAMDDRVEFDFGSMQSLVTIQAAVANIQRCPDDVFQAYMVEHLQEVMEEAYEEIVGRPAKKQRTT